MPTDDPADPDFAARLQRGPLRPEVVARLGVHACRALTRSPQKAGLRRRLAPAAIRLTTTAEGDVAVTVRAGKDEGPLPSPTYLSPEQATHASPADARSDVYSLSVILYEALSGELPLPRCATEQELLTVLVTHEPRPLQEAAPWLRPDLVEVIERGLAREPSARWSSPAELGEALAPFTDGSNRLTAEMIAALPEVARAPEARAAVAAKSPRLLAWLPVAAGLALVAGAAVWLLLRPAPPEPPRTEAVHAASDARTPAKREVARALLEGKSFFVALDPRRPGVLVPEQFRKQPELLLQVGRGLPTPIPDLEIGEAALTATLSFNREPYFCKIPWTAVFALTSEEGKGKLWEKDMPPEVAVEMAMKRARPDAGP